MQKAEPQRLREELPEPGAITALAVFISSQASGSKEGDLLSEVAFLISSLKLTFQVRKEAVREKRTIVAALQSARSAIPSAVCKHTV